MSTIWYGHFDSTEEDERLLLAEDWARYIRTFITDGIRNGGTCLQISEGSGGGLAVRMDAGQANIRGYIFRADADGDGRYFGIELPDAHPSLPRIDRIVLRLDRTIQSRTITPTVLLGTAAAQPVPSTLTRNENIWEISLAKVRVEAAALNIAANKITDERFDTELCGVMNSVLGLDPGAWQAAFDAFLAELAAGWSTETVNYEAAFLALMTALTGQMTEQQADFEGQMTEQAASFGTWFTGAQTELVLAAQFDFENLAAMPGNVCTTAPDGLTSTITNAASGLTLATLETTFPGGSVVQEQAVFQADGETLQSHILITTTFGAGGGIAQSIENLL